MTVERIIEITPKQVASALIGKNIDAIVGQNVRFVCDGVDIFKRDGGGELFQACTMAAHHGVHKRFKEVSEAIAALVSRYAVGPAQECPACNGIGWIPFDSAQATQDRTLSVLCGIFRGIELPIETKELTADSLADTLVSCFTGTLPSEPVTDPPGPAETSDLSRAILFTNNE